jgi:hypothetical protein
MNFLKSRLLYFISLFLLASCSNNNSVFFDLRSQSIMTCDGKPIKQLYITNTKLNVFYHFSKMKGSPGANSFSLSDLNRSYELEILNKKISLSDFKLVSGVEYKLTNRSNGDVAADNITLKVGQDSKIVFASKTSCQ